MVRGDDGQGLQLQGRRVLQEDGIGSVVFAHKTTEGWEALLSGMIRGGWTITGSWPIATERRGASSITRLRRPRHQRAPRLPTLGPRTPPSGIGPICCASLPRRVADWMERLQREGIRGADLVFACMSALRSRSSAATGLSRRQKGDSGPACPITWREVWEVVGRAALLQVLGTAEAQARNGLAGALEEDARLTALFLWTLQSTEVSENNDKKTGENEEAVGKAASRGFSLPFDVVRRFAQPMGIDLDAWTGRIIGQDKGVVRLLPVAERVRDLFGKDGASAAADWTETDPGGRIQANLFPELAAGPKLGVRRRGRKSILDGDAELQTLDATTLDRVHEAMLLQASGHANALRKRIDAEQDRGPDFLRLANALSALYPQGCNEKRLLDAMLLAAPR